MKVTATLSLIFLTAIISGLNLGLTFSRYSVNASDKALAPKQKYIIYYKNNTTEIKRTNALQTLQSKLKTKSIKKNSDNINNKLTKINAESINVENTSLQTLKSLSTGIKDIAKIELDNLASPSEITNDPSLDSLWGIFKMQVASPTTQSAWNIAKGKSSIKVAVLDTGINATHNDLLGVVTQETDFTGSPYGTSDIYGHGTHVAGSIDALGNNNIGVVGVSYGVSILNGKVLGDTGSGYYSWVASGIIWATDQGVNVINMSLGGSSESQVLLDAVNYAVSKGVVVIASAGNFASSVKHYPAGYDPVIAIAATDQNDNKASFSNYGSWVDVAAPGVSIYSSIPGNSYGYKSGTSMASAYASGAAALIWSSGLCTTSSCVINQLFSTADSTAGTGTYYQHGRLNVLRAVGGIVTTPPTPTLTPLPTSTPPPPTPTLTPLPTSTPPTPTQFPTPTLQPTVTVKPAPTRTQTKPPTPTSLPKNITVSTISMSYITKSNGYSISSIPKVVDDGGVTIPGVKITGVFSRPDGTKSYFILNSNAHGIATYSVKKALQKGDYIISILSLNKKNYTYIPSTTTQTLTIE